MELNEYLELHTSPESELLHKINRETHLKNLQPRMLSGHFQGRLLSMLSKMIGPRSILELGTFTGYSALCLAEGLLPGGTLVTIEKNDELEQAITENFNRSEKKSSLQLMIGDVLGLLPSLKQTFDLVFIDADKSEYPEYLVAIKPLLNKEAYIIADNVLWDGKVLHPQKHKDTSTIALSRFNSMIQDDPDFENILLPIRDGLMLAHYKKNN